MSNPALLTYAFATAPSPIQTSSPQSPLNANINIGVISPANQNIYCSQISVAVPTGTDATSLTDGTVAGSLNTTEWSIISNDPKLRAELGIRDTMSLITFMAKDQSVWLINYNLALGLAAQVNSVVGNFTVQVFEKSGTSPSNLTNKDAAFFTLSKQTPGFYLQNFVATAVGSPTVPATEFTSSQSFTLAWESNGTFFQIYQKGNPTPIYAGTQKSCTVAAVPTDTTFFLVAMMTSNPGNNTPPQTFVPIYLYDALTVTVSNPVLAPASINAAGNVTATSLNVNGASVLSGPTTIGAAGATDPCVVNFSTEFKTNLQVDGNATLSNLTVPATGTVNLQGQTNLANSTVSGTTNLNGPANFTGMCTFTGGVAIWGAPPVAPAQPSHFNAQDGSLFMAWMPAVDESPITFQVSSNGMLGWNPSSRRFKDDIQNFSDDFHKILNAQPISFVFKGREGAPRSIGYLAEDFHELGLKGLLVYNKEGEPLVIKYDRVALYLLEIVKEMVGELKSLKEKLNAGVELGSQRKSAAQ